MTFINENMHILILVGVGILALIYLLHYYVHSCIDSEVGVLKKRIKRLSLIQMQQMKNLEQTKINQMNGGEPMQGKNIGFPQTLKGGNITEAIEPIYESTEIDADSYFDPTKSGLN